MFNGKVINEYTGEPLCGAPVTDGRNTVLTDENGEYSLDCWERARVISVGVLTTRHNDWYNTVESGERDFHVHPAQTQNDFCFLHTSDTEIEGREHVEWLDFFRAAVREHKPAFFVNTGDLCRIDGLQRHYQLMNCETLCCPVRYAIGNHDFIGPDYGEQYYERLYGPTWYSFDCGDTHFAVLSIGRGEKPSGYQPSDQWLWLENDLKLNRGKRLIILDHEICSDETGCFVPVVDGVKYDLRKQGLCAWVFGHSHYNYLREFNGVVSACTAQPDSGGIDSSEGAIRIIRVNGGKISSKLLYESEFTDGDAFEWRTRLDGQIAYCTPVADGGRIFVATKDDGCPKKCGVYCLDEKTGSVVWHRPTVNGVKNDLAVDGDTVFAQDCDGNFYALDKESGTLVYKKELTLGKSGHTRKNVLVAGDLVIAGSQSRVYAFDKRTGAPRWERSFRKDVCSPARFVYDKYRDQLLVSSQWYGLIALDLNSGATRWELANEQPLWFRSSTPLVTETAIYTCGLNSFASVDPVTGKYIKTFDCGLCTDSAGAPLPDGDLLYYPTGEGGVTAVDPDTMSPVRRFETGRAAIATVPYTYGNIQTVEGTPVVRGDELVFTASDGCLYVYDKTGKGKIASLSVGAPSYVSPLLTDGGVIVADVCGRITKYKI